ncbi:MFS general substrate transporter [Basidiobolus meristosporus CBS 931.73]|uniref:Lysosomal dipeptide transporter MFSD1 n=1 Tax=Basidiobolus meristosporus CBS 931.73 TaxID=1314790 RepID=A0A1Y1YHF5_9FUNG|nr:MFS general substrate transporter [Basidiobolus meristosporus CBS 931.73]|eukprot:ORX97415.1 MFS general substrate transporter [Basidiobolus meristosporus CBS 931.73]
MVANDCSTSEASPQHALKSHLPQNPAHSWYSWAVLSLACAFMLGQYFCFFFSYEIPGVLSSQLRTHLEVASEDWQYKVSLLFMVTSLPNVIFPFFGGILLDKWGAPFALVLFSILMCAGQAIFSIGVTFRLFWLMCVGRCLFGIGCGSLEIVQGKVTTDWFRGSLLAFALALNLTVGRWGSAADALLSPWICKLTNVTTVSWIGFLVCLFSAMCAFFLIRLDTPQARMKAGVQPEAVGDDGDEVSIKEILKLRLSFWLICLLVISLYGSVQPFLYISSDFLQNKWMSGDSQKAGEVMSIPNLISSIGSPLCGLLVDRIGYHGPIMTISSALIVISHALLGLTMITPILGYSVLGVAYSLFASAVWPCIPCVVKEKQLGTALGIAGIFFNLSISGVPLIVSRIHLATGSYTAMEMFFMFLALIGFVGGLGLNLVSYLRSNGKSVEEDILDQTPVPVSKSEHHSLLGHDSLGRHYA